MIEAKPINNGVKTTVKELMHFGLWGKYCKIMHVTDGYEDPDEELYLDAGLMDLLGI
jgi:hypothetical protein